MKIKRKTDKIALVNNLLSIGLLSVIISSVIIKDEKISSILLAIGLVLVGIQVTGIVIWSRKFWEREYFDSLVDRVLLRGLLRKNNQTDEQLETELNQHRTLVKQMIREYRTNKKETSNENNMSVANR